MTVAARAGRAGARSAPSVGSKALVLVLAVVLATGVLPTIGSRPAQANAPGFSDSVMFTGLEQPTSFQFSSDGRVFVAEKSGLVKVFDSLSDSSPDVFADLRTQVHNYWDRGLLGLALAPTFPADPYVYVLYAHDAEIGGTAPRWGSPGQTSDPCPTPPGPNDDGCVISGRLSRFLATGNTAGPEQVLIEDWCAQYPSHTIGDLKFGPDGSLYVSGGDGASFNFTDYGQVAGNPCNDYPGGTDLSPPDTRGGGLRSQKVITDGVPVSLDGAVLRVDPATGEGLPSNPFASSADPNARRIVAMGLRNPFRLAIRPGTEQVYIGDVGSTTWEEINVVADAGDSVAENFGWPCYEGNFPQAGYQALGADLCEDLYDSATATGPLFNYLHGDSIVPGDGCPVGGGDSITGVAFNDDSNDYPSEYDGALFFTDLQHQCIWVMLAGQDGNPDPNNVQHFMDAENPVYLTPGPEGDLWYADIGGGRLHRISFGSTAPTDCPADEYVAEYFNNQLMTGAPVLSRCETEIDNDWGTAAPAPGVNTDQFSVRWSATRTFTAGTYEFTATADDGVRVYLDDVPIIDEWHDGPATTYTASRSLTAGSHEVRVEYYDNGLAAVAKFSYASTGGGGNSPPTATIDAPTAATTWKVGDTITFAGSATDPEDGALPASALTWQVSMLHCPDGCHEHVIQSFPGVAGGSIVAPDHDYPSKLQFELTATDSQGTPHTATTVIDPQTATLRFESVPSGLSIAHGSVQAATPFERTVVVGSANSIGASTPQTLAGTTYDWDSWSDGGARNHNVAAVEGVTTFTATFTPGDPGDPGTCPAGQFLAEYFNNLTLTGTPVLSRCEATINNDWGVGSPGPGVNIDGFSVRWTGAPTFEAGEHVFSTTADDGVRVFVDDVSLIDQWHDQGPTTYTASRTLTAGAHPVRMEFYENGGGAVARLSWTNLGDPGDPGDPGTCTAGQFTAEYFNNLTLTGTPVLSRCEATINNDWGVGSPGPGVNIDGFSVRWTGAPTFEAGEHVFSTTADDGVRVFVDDVSLIDQWHDQGPTTYTASRTLTAGAHPVRMEFYENGGGAVARLSWTNLGDPGDPGDPGPCPTGQFTAEYFNNLTLSGTPVLTRCEATIDNGWGGGSPAPGVNADGFSVRWTGSHLFSAGSYEFTAIADDGVRAFVDDVVLIDQWHDQGPTAYTASQTLTAGAHTVRVEYYENGGGADARFSWALIGGGPNQAPTATITTPTSATTWVADDTIAFAGSATDPDDGALAASALTWRVSVLHCPDVCHEHLVYTFTGVASGSFVAPEPEDPSLLQIELTAVDAGGLDHTVTTLLAPEGACPTGQFQAEYFNNTTFTGAPVLTRCEAAIDNDWGVGSPDPAVNVDGFSVRWTGMPVFESGSHVFSTTADDGVRVLVDGVAVIDQWHDQGPTTYMASRTLTAGVHLVRMEFYENGGGAVARLSWNNFGDPDDPGDPGDPGGGSCPAGQFLAEYFNNLLLTGAPVLSRCEATIDNDWGVGSPGPGVNIDGFSVRWTGSPVFTAGTHLFTVTADDGVRVFVDDLVLIDQWKDQAPATYAASRTLAAGAHAVRVEFYENGGGAVAALSWTSP
jgi:glucose/arabinose dehydrogenase